MSDNTFQLLKETCNAACHERHACADGFKQMLEAENVSQMMAAWRANWEDVVESKYAGIIRTELPKQYTALKAEMNDAGIYMNECPKGAKNFVRVIVTDTEDLVRIYGEAKAYVLGEAKVIAFDHSQVYNSKCADAQVMLYDYAFGNITVGKVSAYNRSSLHCCCNAFIAGSVHCDAFGGIVVASFYCHINAYLDTVVYSDGNKGIILNGDSQLKPLKDYEQ